MEVAEEATPVEPITDSNNDSEDEVMSVVIDQDEDKESVSKDDIDNADNAKDKPESPKPNSEDEIVVETLDEEVQGAVGGEVRNETEDKPSSDPKQIGAKRSFDHLSDNVRYIVIYFNFCNSLLVRFVEQAPHYQVVHGDLPTMDWFTCQRLRLLRISMNLAPNKLKIYSQ